MTARPLFTRDFPADEALDALVTAFARGDYAEVRARAPALARSAADEAVRRAARTLLERTKPDPLALWILALSAGLLLAVSTYWMTHGRRPADPAPPRVRTAAPDGTR